MVERRGIPVRKNWIDVLVEKVDPVGALGRMEARARLAWNEAFIGGGRQRSMFGWSPWGGDADADILGDLPTLRQRCRDLERNSALASGAIATKVTNVVGGGIIPQPKPDRRFLGWTVEQAEEWQYNVAREFSMWADSLDCDMERTQTFYDLQDLIFRSMLTNGDVLVNLPFNKVENQPYNLRIQLIEADRLSNPDNKQDGENNIWAGIEKDQWNAPKAYYISNIHPGALSIGIKMTWAKIDAYGAKTGRRNILHVFQRKRVGQTRGLPDLSAVIEPLKQLQRYSEAEITAAVISAAFTVFVKSANGGTFKANPSSANTSQSTGWTQDSAASKANSMIGMAPGAVVGLADGDDVSFANPNRPSTAFDGFVMSVLRQIGVGLELPFEVLIKHYTASYSAARAALLEAWRYYLKTRQWMVGTVCQPIYEEWLAEAVAVGRIKAPGFFEDPAKRKAYAQATWVGPGKGQIQPLQETNAAIARIDSGISTIEKEKLELDGSEWSVDHEQSVIENNRRVKDGLKLAVDAQLKAKAEADKAKQDNQNDNADNQDKNDAETE